MIKNIYMYVAMYVMIVYDILNHSIGIGNVAVLKLTVVTRWGCTSSSEKYQAKYIAAKCVCFSDSSNMSTSFVTYSLLSHSGF